jgi:hypothetical protein
MGAEKNSRSHVAAPQSRCILVVVPEPGMGVDFDLAAWESKEFLALHKWPVIEAAARQLLRAHLPEHYPFVDTAYVVAREPLGVNAVKMPSHELQEAAKNYRGGVKWIEDTASCVEEFVTRHEAQTIFLVCDIGEQPWSFGERDWTLWREVPGPHFYHSYLPRNLYEDLGCRSWTQVIMHLAEKHDHLLHEQLADDLGEIKLAFEMMCDLSMKGEA